MKRFLFDCGTRDTTASIGVLALRLMTGLMMLIGHGLPKLQNYAMLKDKFDLKIFPFQYFTPSINLMLCVAAELGAAAFIIIGLCTRPAAFLLGFTMVVAAFGVHGADPWFMGPGVPVSKEPALLYLIPMIAIILTGGGAFSIDAAVYKEGKRRRW
jgi:putative oxidoreductase